MIWPQTYWGMMESILKTSSILVTVQPTLTVEPSVTWIRSPMLTGDVMSTCIFDLNQRAKEDIRDLYIIQVNFWYFLLISSRKHAYSIIMTILPPKNENSQINKSDIFSYFCSKHRLWVLAEAVLTSTHNICFWAEIRKIIYTSVNPSFTV